MNKQLTIYQAWIYYDDLYYSDITNKYWIWQIKKYLIEQAWQTRKNKNCLYEINNMEAI